VVSELELDGAVEVPGFVSSDEVEELMSRALCLLLPSRREGYGLVVIEAATFGTPSVVVAGADNAAVELVEPGVNGFISPSPAAADLAAAILRVHEAGSELRASTAGWFVDNARRMSLGHSLELVLQSYGHPLSVRS
jgi:glycosyltransferase involved in cell wall biosynthesis